jgi:hypothetical protein
MKLTEQQINTLMKHVLHLQEQPSFDNIDSIRGDLKQQRLRKQQKKDRLAKRGLRPIPGLTGRYSTPLTGTQSNWIAKIIYDAKGTVSDNENNATRAILAIKDKKEFDETQRALQKLTRGKGIGQYVSGFFGTYTASYVKSLKQHNISTKLSPAGTIGLESLHNRNHWKTESRLNKIIAHLKKINVGSATLSVLEKTYSKIKQIASLEKKIWQSSSIKAGIDFAVEYRHEILLVLEILTAMSGPYGYLISMGVGFINSAMYASEGEYYQAGIQGILSIMPGVFKLAGKLPQLVKLMTDLGERGLVKLGAKLASKNAKFIPIEQKILKGLFAAKNLIKPIFNEAAQISAKRAAMKAVMKMKGAETAAAGFGRLTAKDKIIIGLANSIFNIAEFSIMWGKFGVATDFAVDQIWNKIYERYIMQTEIDQALNRQIAADYKKLTANNTSTNK